MTLHLLVGPVGAGKSTWGQRRALTGALFLDLDRWMVRLFGADQRPSENVLAWYFERRERCRALMWDVACDALRAGTDVILELGLLTAAERERFYALAHDEAFELSVHVFDAPRDVRRERVQRRNDSNEPHTQRVPLEVFERASDAWEPPSDAERANWPLLDG